MGTSKLNDIYCNIISENVFKYRTLRNFTQDDLCRELSLLGVTLYNNDIYRIEHNKRSVKDFELYAIAKVLKVNISDLYEGIEDKLIY